MSARVLVVEDDQATLTFLMELLRGWGYDTDGALTGTGALERMARRCPDVVISDLVMPGMSGLDLLQAIRAQEDCRVTFFLITGKCSVSVGVEAIERGADECLLKPFEPETLLARLEQRGFHGHA